MAEMAAMASGDPRILERVQLDAEVKKLACCAAHNRRQQSIEGAVRQNERDLRELPERIEAAKRDDAAILDAIDAAEQDQANRSIDIDGEQFTNLSDAVAAAQSVIDSIRAETRRRNSASISTANR